MEKEEQKTGEYFMNFLSKNVYQMMNLQTYRKVLFFCIILMMMSGIAAGADRDVIIGFKKTVGPSEDDFIRGHGGAVKKEFHIISAISAKVPEENIENMKKDSRVKYIVNDSIFKVADEYTASWGVQHINSQFVHDQNIKGSGIKIAVLDTGIDYNHVDLNANFKGGVSFVLDQYGNVINPDGLDDSYDSHGTHVAGIIAADDNGIGVIGVAPDASLYAVKVLDGAGFSTASWIISGIEWAMDKGSNIITMSLESTEDNTAVFEAVNVAYNSGILLVAAGGNTYGGSINYPAAYDSVIAVTATDMNDQKASFSPIDPKIEIAAPGMDIYSTIINNGYGYRSGTSMAAPHVTGVAALIYSTNFNDLNRDGKYDNKDVRLLLHNTKDLGIIGRDDTFGYGLVDAQMAVLGIVSKPIINLTLRVNNGPTKDAQSVNLSQGRYSVNIHNINLSKVIVKVYKNGIYQKRLYHEFEFSPKRNDVNFNLIVNDVFEVVFIPHGKKGSMGYVTIKTL